MQNQKGHWATVRDAGAFLRFTFLLQEASVVFTDFVFKAHPSSLLLLLAVLPLVSPLSTTTEAASTKAAAEHVPEHVRVDFELEIATTTAAKVVMEASWAAAAAASSVLFQALLAVLVVDLALVLVSEHFVSRGDVLELFLHLFVAWVLVRMEPLRRLPIRFLDNGLGCITRYP